MTTGPPNLFMSSSLQTYHMKYLLQDGRRRCSHSATSGLIVSVRGNFLVNYDDDL